MGIWGIKNLETRVGRECSISRRGARFLMVRRTNLQTTKYSNLQNSFEAKEKHVFELLIRKLHFPSMLNLPLFNVRRKTNDLNYWKLMNIDIQNIRKHELKRLVGRYIFHISPGTAAVQQW